MGEQDKGKLGSSKRSSETGTGFICLMKRQLVVRFTEWMKMTTSDNEMKRILNDKRERRREWTK